MWKQKSTIWIKGLFSSQKGENKQETKEHDKGSWRAEHSRIPAQYSALPSFISAERVRMCQWRPWCLSHHTQIWWSIFSKSCLLIFLLLALEEPKWYSKPELSQHFNDLVISCHPYGPPDENQVLYMCSKIYVCLSSGGFAVFIQISWYSVAERKPFWNKLILCFVFHKIKFLPPSLQNVIALAKF